MATKFSLIVESPDGGRTAHSFSAERVTLGRDPSCDLTVEQSVGSASRRHAEINVINGELILSDTDSFNGTFVNGNRITAPRPIKDGDRIQLGVDSPSIRVEAPLSGSAVNDGTVVAAHPGVSADNAEFVRRIDLESGPLTIGRSEDSDVRLDSLQISNKHARLSGTPSGIEIVDLNSTNGVYVDGVRITSKTALPFGGVAQLGPFVIRNDGPGTASLYDSRSRTRIDAINIVKDVPNRSGGGMIRLLDGVSLAILPNEFIGLLGPSGAGKSTLMDAMNGMRPASSGSILVNDRDLYANLSAIKQSIGYVPQDDIIHRDLTVYRTLYYVAKLRLSADVSPSEIETIIDEVLDVTGLTERRDVAISQLSGGQRKRVSIAVELITKPSVIYLDEPTSGLDPATEEKIMTLFQRLAQSGRTIILTTHAMENVKLFDKIVVMMRGKLVFYGKPAEALAHVGASSFKDLYDKLEEPIGERLGKGSGSIQQVTEQVAEEWKQKFVKTPQFRSNVYDPLINIGTIEPKPVRASEHRLGIGGSIRQFLILSRRYAEVLTRDRLNLLILFAQAPIIALLTFLVMGDKQPRDFAYFILSLVAVWFGTSVAAREIIRERPIYNRERMVNVGLAPYIFSKLFVLTIIVGIQCLLLFVPLKVLDLTGAMAMPGELLGVPQLWIMLLTAVLGIAIGLLVSAQVKTSELATSLIPLILIPQILFSGLIGVPSGANRVVGLLMPAAWAFDSMKRFSTLDTLEEEGSDAKGLTGGRGYYKYIETENDRIIAESKQNIDDYKKDAEKKIDTFESSLRDGRNPAKPKLDDPPKPADARKIDKKEMSNYVSFLHPWMGKELNQIVLAAMLVLLIAATFIVLRLQEVDQ